MDDDRICICYHTFDVVRNIQAVLALIRITAYLPGCMSLAVEQYQEIIQAMANREGRNHRLPRYECL